MTCLKAVEETSMIKVFSTLFAGHVDFEDRGQYATPVNDRLYSNDHLVTVFDKTQAMAQLMDELGYDIMGYAEHHLQREGYECLPNMFMLSAHMEQVTK